MSEQTQFEDLKLFEDRVNNELLLIRKDIEILMTEQKEISDTILRERRKFEEINRKADFLIRKTRELFHELEKRNF